MLRVHFSLRLEKVKRCFTTKQLKSTTIQNVSVTFLWNTSFRKSGNHPLSPITSSWSLLQQSLIRDATQTPFLPWYVYEQSPDKNLVPTFFCVHRAFWSSDFWSVVIKFSQVCLKQYSRITRMPFVWSLNTFLIFNLIMTNEPRGLFVMTIYAE